MKKKIVNVVVVIIIVAVSIACSYVTKVSTIADKSLTKQQDPICEIIDKTVISQIFTLDRDEIDSFRIKFGTYERKCQGELHVILKYQGTNDVIKEVDIDISKLKNNAYYDIDLNKAVKLKSRKLELTVEGLGTKSGSTVTMFGYNAVTKNTQLTFLNTMKVTKQTLDAEFQLHHIYSLQRTIYLIVTMLLLYIYVTYVLRTIITKK